MPRVPHVVGKFGPGRNPDCIVCVQGAVRREFLSDSDEVGINSLATWDALVLTPKGDSYAIVDQWKGGDAGQWWERLAGLYNEVRTVLLVSNYAREQAAILGLWDKLLDGTANLNGDHQQGRGEGEQSSLQQWQGSVILEGPPTIIRFTLLSAAGATTWVDVRNYGGGHPDDPAAAVLLGHPDDDLWGPEPWTKPALTGGQVKAVSLWVQSYMRMLRSLNLGGLELTAASQAQAAYRRQYMAHPITCHDNARVLAMERAALYGGRCECRFLGTVRVAGVQAVEPDDADKPTTVHETTGKVYHLDVNALYPSVAYSAMLPTALATFCRFVSVTDLAAVVRCTPCIADVSVGITEPVLPLHYDRRYGWPDGMKAQNRIDAAAAGEPITIYPVGEFRATLCGPEIALAMRRGTISKCHSLAIYEGRPIYYRWVGDLYAARRHFADAGQLGMAHAVKSLLNASFSKWAQRAKRWISEPDEVCHMPFYQWWQRDPKGGPPVQWRSFAWGVQRLADAGEPADSFPAITAYVNSLGRVRLWELLTIASKGIVFYYDTDSIWCDRAAYDALCEAHCLGSYGLGNLKTVGVYDEVDFLGIKRYIAGGKLTMAGAGHPTMATGDAFALAQTSPPVGYYLAHREPPGIERRVSRVRLKTPYPLGRVEPSGWVKPWRIN